MFKPVLLGGCDGHQSRAQNAVCNQVTFLKYRNHGIGFLLSRHNRNGLVLVRIELGTRFWVNFNDFMALQSAFELTQCGLRAFAQLFLSGVGNGQTRSQAVSNGQQALGKGFHRELAGFGNFLICAATGVLYLGLGT